MSTLFDIIAPDQADPRLGGKLHAQRVADDYSTPPHYAERVRAALGGIIACDPASTFEDNQIIRAPVYYTHENSGLDPSNRWISPVYLNPPSARRGDFLKRAAYEAKARCEMIICLNTKHLCAGYAIDTVLPLANAYHIPRGRPAFLHGKERKRTESPTDGRVFIYIGHRPQRFCAEFAKDAGCTMLEQNYRITQPRGQAEIR